MPFLLLSELFKQIPSFCYPLHIVGSRHFHGKLLLRVHGIYAFCGGASHGLPHPHVVFAARLSDLTDLQLGEFSCRLLILQRSRVLIQVGAVINKTE